VVFNARMSATTVRALLARSSEASLPGISLPPTKPIGVMPAAVAAAMPGAESSTTMHCAGSTWLRAAASRNRSGAGLPLRTSLAENRRGSKKADQPGDLEARADAIERGRRGNRFRSADPCQRMGRMGNGAQLRAQARQYFSRHRGSILIPRRSRVAQQPISYTYLQTCALLIPSAPPPPFWLSTYAS